MGTRVTEQMVERGLRAVYGSMDMANAVGATLHDGARTIIEGALEGTHFEPIPMVLYCPACGTQHIDAPEPARGWTNPPHRSHLCHACGAIWRPADVQTTGVACTQTRGKGDTWNSLTAVRDIKRAMEAKP